MISFKSALGQSCIASGFDASPTVFFTTTFTMKELDSLSSAVSGITISISSTGISPEGSSTLSDTSDINGEVFFSIFYTAIGSITINLNCNTVEVDTLITTSVIPVLTFGSNILPSTIGSLSTITASVENAIGDVETTNAAYICGITLFDGATDVTSKLTVILSAASSTGVCSFSGLRIVNAWTYTYKVTATSGSVAFDLSSSSFIITSTVSSVTIATSTSTQTVYFNFDATVTILGDGGYAFLDSAAITLAMDDSSTIGGYSSQTTTTGTYIFNIYLKTVAGTTLKATVNSISGIKSLTVKSLKFFLSMSTTVSITQPTISTDKFSLTLGVYNDAGDALESINYNSGAYPFALTLVPLAQILEPIYIIHSLTKEAQLAHLIQPLLEGL